MDLHVQMHPSTSQFKSLKFVVKQAKYYTYMKAITFPETRAK